VPSYVVRPVFGEMIDCSTQVSAETAKAIKAAGKVAIMRGCDFPNVKWAEPGVEEIRGILDAGLGLILYFMWRSRYGLKVAGEDAVRRHALIEALGLPPDQPTCVDYESVNSHTAYDVEAYARNHCSTFAVLGRTNRGGYWANSVARGGAKLGGTHDWWCESGERPYEAVWVPAKYEMKQHPNPPNTKAVFVAGHPVDLCDAYGVPALFKLSAEEEQNLTDYARASNAQWHTENPPKKDPLPPPE
jgi:hypothetical protein